MCQQHFLPTLSLAHTLTSCSLGLVCTTLTWTSNPEVRECEPDPRSPTRTTASNWAPLPWMVPDSLAGGTPRDQDGYGAQTGREPQVPTRAKSLSFCFCFSVLRCNSHIIKFTIIKHTIQWLLIYSQGCTTVSTNSRTYLSLQKETLVTPHTPLLPGPENHSVTACPNGSAYSDHFI